jgi:tetratricopeptide (TPR) repeat protein
VTRPARLAPLLLVALCCSSSAHAQGSLPTPGLRDEIDQQLEAVVRGRPLASTYPAALEARAELLALASPSAKRALVDTLLARGSTDPLLGMAAMDVLREYVVLDGHEVIEGGGAAWLNPLLDQPFSDQVLDDLAGVYATLPEDALFAALAPVLEAEGRPLAAARAARVLAEVVPAKSADDAAALVLPLLSHADPLLRRAALQALELLPLDDEVLAPAVDMISDDDPGVSMLALRTVGERRLVEGRAAAEEIALDAAQRHELRVQAVVSLALLGDQEAVPVLLTLAEDPDAAQGLRSLAVWGLAVLDADEAHGLLVDALGKDPSLPYLYTGLARLGAPDGLTTLGQLLDHLLDGQAFPPEYRDQTVQALGWCPEGDARRTSGMLLDFLDRKPWMAQGDPGPDSQEFGLALTSIRDLGGEPAREAMAELFLAGVPEDHRYTVLAALFYGRAPADEELAEALSNSLATAVADSQRWYWERLSAGQALWRLDPDAARPLFEKILDEGDYDQPALGRGLARGLAACGDTTYMAEHAMPFSLKEVDSADASRRVSSLIDLGIDYLYADRFDEALRTYRQVQWSEPENSYADYNMACAFGLTGGAPGALRYLRRSIRNSYRDYRHMARDTDLELLWEDPRFVRLYERLRLADELQLTYQVAVWPR